MKNKIIKIVSIIIVKWLTNSDPQAQRRSNDGQSDEHCATLVYDTWNVNGTAFDPRQSVRRWIEPLNLNTREFSSLEVIYIFLSRIDHSPASTSAIDALISSLTITVKTQCHSRRNYILQIRQITMAFAQQKYRFSSFFLHFWRFIWKPRCMHNDSRALEPAIQRNYRGPQKKRESCFQPRTVPDRSQHTSRLSAFSPVG